MPKHKDRPVSIESENDDGCFVRYQDGTAATIKREELTGDDGKPLPPKEPAEAKEGEAKA